MEKLISMRLFVLERILFITNNDISESDLLAQIFLFAKFLSQKLELWMFVPCKFVDGVWVVLDEPTIKPNTTDSLNYTSRKLQYQEAKERVLFEGIEYVKARHENSYSIVRICKSLSTINYPDHWEGVTVERLIPYNISLTLTAKKQIGWT